MNVLLGLLFLLLCMNQLKNVFSQVESTNILDCKIEKGSKDDRAELNCVIPGNVSGLVLTEDSLRRIVIYDEDTKKNTTLNDYPHAVTTVFMHLESMVRGNVTIKENALKALANVTFLRFRGASSSPTIILPTEEFRNTPNLRWLFLSHVAVVGNTIDFIRASAGLEIIGFVNVPINTLKRDTFSGMAHLKNLRFDNNEFDNIENGTFDGLNELETFSINGNNKNLLAQGLPKDSKKLRGVDLHNNSITTVRKSPFKTYTRLKSITLSSNPITNIEAGVFDDQENLAQLWLASCPIHNLPDGLFQNTKSLTVLRLANTTIRQINSTTFQGLRNLGSLSLDENKLLTTIETGAFDDLVDVTHLYMRNIPNLVTLPDGLFKNMKKLRVIDFFETYPQNLVLSNFSHCPHLSMVSMHDEGSKRVQVVGPQGGIGCKIVKLPVNDSHQLTCNVVTPWKTAILTPQTMRQMRIPYNDGQNYTIGEYPGEITTLIIRGDESLVIAENTMALFPKLTRLHVWLDGVGAGMATLTIPADEFSHTPYLRTVLVERFDLANSTKEAIQSIKDRNNE